MPYEIQVIFKKHVWYMPLLIAAVNKGAIVKIHNEDFTCAFVWLPISITLNDSILVRSKTKVIDDGD